MKIYALAIVFSIAVMAMGFTQEETHKYAGTKACMPCHTGAKKGDQAGIWKASSHAKAYEALSSVKAIDAAKAKGIDKPQEAKECLECHTLGKTVPATALDEKFDIKDGVQCESCHGAGSDYRKPAIMKDKAQAVAAGMTDWKDDAAIEAFCKGCHNEKSPTFKGFNFAEMYAKIKHAKPKE